VIEDSPVSLLLGHRNCVEETHVVREIFALAAGREGRPLGVKAIACRLTERGITRRGVRFSTGSVYEILTSSTYYGQHHFNRRDSRTGAPCPPSQWVGIEVPAIIDESTFNEVQALMQSRSPKRTPPPVVNGPTFLAGIARCGYWRRHDPEHRQGRALPLLLLLEQAEEGAVRLPWSAHADGEA
jgi:Recombinase